MGYSVYVRAAAEFMAAFYEALFEGETVMRAVARGRQQLRRRNKRPSPKGDLPLHDWCVPVHYGRRAVSFPQLKRVPERRPKLSLDAALARLAAPAADPSKAAEDALAPEGGAFFGRDRAFYRLEQALGREPITLVHGLGGTGKTELAKAFARWLQRTGWTDAPPVFHELKPGLATFNLAGIVAAIGRAVYGERFSLVEPAQQQGLVLQALTEHRLVVILDNFESVRTMPDPTGATPPLSETDAQGLAAFLQALRTRRVPSCILITSRSPEPWLGEINRLELGGLKPEEVNEYVDHLIGRLPNAPARREKKAFGELLERLGGHPLSLRLMLPQLDRREPEALLQALRGEGSLDVDNVGGDRIASLDVCMRYSLDQLDAETADKLVVLTLFEDVADADVLGFLATVEGCPARLFGETAASWRERLAAATGLGLLTDLGSGMYRLHPALPASLVHRWRERAGIAYAAEREAAEHAYVGASAEFGEWLRSQIKGGEAGLAFQLIDRQRRSLGRALGEALARGLFASAQAIMQTLDVYWENRGLVTEAEGWVQRIRATTEDAHGHVPALDTPSGALWAFAVRASANRAQYAGRLDEAQRIYHEIAQTLAAMPGDEALRDLAPTYHQLGVVAQRRGALDEAEAWYRRALTLEEQLGGQPDVATSYHQLGMVAAWRGALNEAEAWYRKALAIEEQLRNRPGVAMSYGQLGLLYEARGDLPPALDWIVRCVTLFADFPHPATGPGPKHLARLTARLGLPALESAWRRATGQSLPGHVRAWVEAWIGEGEAGSS
jgi:tetratricopeptide (TPR) repeat protein